MCGSVRQKGRERGKEDNVSPTGLPSDLRKPSWWNVVFFGLSPLFTLCFTLPIYSLSNENCTWQAFSHQIGDGHSAQGNIGGVHSAQGNIGGVHSAQGNLGGVHSAQGNLSGVHSAQGNIGVEMRLQGDGSFWERMEWVADMPSPVDVECCWLECVN